MLVGDYKDGKDRASSATVNAKPRLIWKTKAYPVPSPSRSAFRWKASALRNLPRWAGGAASVNPVTIMVPALYNLMPAESLAMGWLNEIDALVTIRQRMIVAAKLTGWDVFTFHTLHNLDRYFDSTIAAVRDTWVNEGNLSPDAILETRKRFARPCDYYRVQPRLVENLVFQSALLDWVSHRAAKMPLRFHVVGTALLSALVSAGSVSFADAVTSVLKFGGRWDEALSGLSGAKTENDIGWSRFEHIRKLLEGRSLLSLGVAREDLPEVRTPLRPFRYSTNTEEPPVLVKTAEDAAAALNTLNLSSWGYAVPKPGDEAVRGWLMSPLHPMARLCRWTVSNYLLATPSAAALFLDHIATLGCQPAIERPAEAVQNRLRLSRVKVTGP